MLVNLRSDKNIAVAYTYIISIIHIFVCSHKKYTQKKFNIHVKSGYHIDFSKRKDYHIPNTCGCINRR